MTDGKPRIGDEVYIHGYIDEIRNDVIIIRNEGGYFGTSDREIFYYEEDERGYGTMNEADRKTESNSEKPNNSTISKMEQVETMSCQECKHYNGNDGCDVMTSNKAKCNYEPIEDEPQKDCFLCKWLGKVDVCGRCRNRNLFAEADTEPKPKTEPQKWETPPKFEHKGFTTTCVSVPAFAVEDEPQTSCKTCRYGEVDEGYVRCAYYSKSAEQDEPQTDCDHRCVQTEIGCEQTDCAWK